MPEPLSQPDQIDALWDYDHPAESEAAFRRALEEWDAQADLDLQLELLTQIARAQGLQRRFDEAHATLDTVEVQLGGATSRVLIRYLLERGRVYNSSRQLERAKSYFAGAWDLASTAGDHRATGGQPGMERACSRTGGALISPACAALARHALQVV